MTRPEASLNFIVEVVVFGGVCWFQIAILDCQALVHERAKRVLSPGVLSFNCEIGVPGNFSWDASRVPYHIGTERHAVLNVLRWFAHASVLSLNHTRSTVDKKQETHGPAQQRYPCNELKSLFGSTLHDGALACTW